MKTVVVDFSNLDDLSGFGEIARNYAPRLAKVSDALLTLHFIFIVPERHKGEFGSHIDYVSREHLKRDIKPYAHHIDLWHATHQQFKYRMHGKGIHQLLTVHDLNYLHEKHGIHLLKHKLKMPLMIRRSDTVTVISEYVKHDVEAHIPLLNKELQVIYNGISDVEQQEQRKPAFAGDTDKFFLCIGQVREKKNLHTLIPVMQYFPQHKLFICGANHWSYADTLRALIAPADRERILLTGKIADDEKCWLWHPGPGSHALRHEGILVALQLPARGMRLPRLLLGQLCPRGHGTGGERRVGQLEPRRSGGRGCPYILKDV